MATAPFKLNPRFEIIVKVCISTASSSVQMKGETNIAMEAKKGNKIMVTIFHQEQSRPSSKDLSFTTTIYDIPIYMLAIMRPLTLPKINGQNNTKEGPYVFM